MQIVFGDNLLREHPSNSNTYKLYARLAGKLLDVDINLLYNHKFYLYHIIGTGISSMCIDSESVDDIIDDVRIGKYYCTYCGRINNPCMDVERVKQKCIRCGKLKLIEFIPGSIMDRSLKNYIINSLKNSYDNEAWIKPPMEYKPC